MFSGMSYGELVFFGAIALLIFGSKLPEVARSLGGTYRQLRSQLNEFQREFNIDTYDPPKKTTYTPPEEDPVPTQQTTAPKFTPPPEED